MVFDYGFLQKPGEGLPSLLSQLDQEIQSLEEGLRSFDFGSSRPELPQLQRKPGLAGAIGATLTNIVQPGTAEAFAQRADEINRFNTQLMAQYAQDTRDAVQGELAAKYGIDMAKFKEMVSLRSELMREALKAQSGLGGLDNIQLRDTWNKRVKAIQSPDGPRVIEDIMADPQQRALAMYSMGITSDADPQVLRNSLNGLYSAYAQNEGQENKRLGQGDVRLSQGQRRIELSEVTSLVTANAKVSEAEQEIAALDASIVEAENKFEPGLIARVRAALSGQPLDRPLTDEELNKPLKLRTKVLGKEKFTLRELLQARQIIQNELGILYQNYPQLQGVFQQPVQEQPKQGNLSQDDILKIIGGGM